ncbi:hypothetical protein VTJ49DRAFT_4231 [Mycothermus thermophilus]|uniref:Uncharacterized protein n=1 Tax=Humicola insolens TaxID=85995 RepID=A0ABR3V5T9_HUMIN
MPSSLPTWPNSAWPSRCRRHRPGPFSPLHPIIPPQSLAQQRTKTLPSPPPDHQTTQPTNPVSLSLSHPHSDLAPQARRPNRETHPLRRRLPPRRPTSPPPRLPPPRHLRQGPDLFRQLHPDPLHGRRSERFPLRLRGRLPRGPLPGLAPRERLPGGRFRRAPRRGQGGTEDACCVAVCVPRCQRDEVSSL